MPTDQLLEPEFIRRIERLSLVSKKIFAGSIKGERRSKKRGMSAEFADHRDYSPGDDIRSIDWNIYVRLDRLFLKLFLEEEDLHVYVQVFLFEEQLEKEPVEPDVDIPVDRAYIVARRIIAMIGELGRHSALLRAPLAFDRAGEYLLRHEREAFDPPDEFRLQ